MPRKPDATIAIFDLDKTITDRDTFACFLLGYLKREPRLWLHTIGLPWALLRYGLLGKDNGWLKERFLNAILGGHPRSALVSWIDEFVATLLASGVRPGARDAIALHRAAGDELVLATASLDFYVEKIGAGLGFDKVISTPAEWCPSETLSGKLAGANCYGGEKLRRVKVAYASRRRRTVAYSDHQADLPLLTWAELGVAVNPTPRLAREAARHGLKVVDWGAPRPRTSGSRRTHG